ncbi:hypothetical protein SAMN05518865_115151 [Duganella sp. CF458]|nr:hypothetical protein SAMN05518865_115151 [Duganella sp. CF458]
MNRNNSNPMTFEAYQKLPNQIELGNFITIK